MRIETTIGLILLILAFSCSKQESPLNDPSDLVAKTITVKGKAVLKNKAGENVLSIGDVVHAHDRIVTGPESTVEVLIKGQGMVRIPEKQDLELSTLAQNIAAQTEEATSMTNKLKQDRNSTSHRNSASGDLWFIFKLLIVVPLIWIARGIFRYFTAKHEP